MPGFIFHAGFIFHGSMEKGGSPPRYESRALRSNRAPSVRKDATPCLLEAMTFPSRYVGLTEARARHGARVDRLGHFLTQGDAPADAAVASLAKLPPRV